MTRCISRSGQQDGTTKDDNVSATLDEVPIYMQPLRTYEGGGLVEAQSMVMLLPGCAGTVSAAGCAPRPHARSGSVVDVIGLVVAICQIGLSAGTVAWWDSVSAGHIALVAASGTYLAAALWVDCLGMTCRRSSGFAHSHGR